MTNEEKVRENRLRRVAARRGFVLSKIRRVDPKALDYGKWILSTAGGKTFVGTINEIEKALEK